MQQQVKQNEIYKHYIALDWSKKNFALASIRDYGTSFKVKEYPPDLKILKQCLMDLSGRKILTTPSNTGDPIMTTYKVYRKVSNGEFENIVDVEYNTREFLDLNVSNNVSYTYYITAANSNGESNHSNEVLTRPHKLGTNGIVRTSATFGNNLIIGGGFSEAGGNIANNIAQWNGTSWSALGSGITDEVFSIDTDGNIIYASDIFRGGVSKWNGSQWTPLSSGPNVEVYSIKIVGNYAGGSFGQIGTLSANNIAKWNGSTWTALGVGTNSTVFAIAILSNDIYIGGDFTQAGGVSANHIARWNGSTWTALGSGLNSRVNSICIKGNNLYVGGTFTQAGGVSANHVAVWNGSTWMSLGSGLSGTVYSISTDNINIYAGGNFYSNSGGVSKWNSSWSPLGLAFGSGTLNNVIVSNSTIYAAGSFIEVNSRVVGNIVLLEWNRMEGILK